MKLRIVSMVGLALLFASAVAAQTKVTGKMQCPKPDAVGTAEAGDQAGHTLTLEKNTCTWSTPMEMVGGKSKDGTNVAFAETSPTRASTSGTYVGNMDNGDKFYLSFHWAVVKDGKPQSWIERVNGTWAFTGGTGKLKGISTIIAYIRNSGNSYGLNADQIIYLRQQGLSDAVIRVMLSQPRAGVAGRQE